MVQRDRELFTLDEAAGQLGVSPEFLADFLDRETDNLIADGIAHYEGDDLIIDGGA